MDTRRVLLSRWRSVCRMSVKCFGVFGEFCNCKSLCSKRAFTSHKSFFWNGGAGYLKCQPTRASYTYLFTCQPPSKSLPNNNLVYSVHKFLHAFTWIPFSFLSFSFSPLVNIQLVGALGFSNPVNHANKIRPYCCDSNPLDHFLPPSVSPLSFISLLPSLLKCGMSLFKH